MFARIKQWRDREIVELNSRWFPLTLAALVCLFLAATGCSMTGVTPPGDKAPVEAVADRVVVEGGRGLILANLAYQTVGTAAAIGIEQGAITGGTKLKVQRASQRAIEALEAGERAVLTADKAASAAAALAAVDELCGLHPTLARACSALR